MTIPHNHTEIRILISVQDTVPVLKKRDFYLRGVTQPHWRELWRKNPGDGGVGSEG